MVPYTITVANVDSYYDAMYAGYSKSGNADFTQNCHGYAFGVGGWPQDSTYGADILLSPGTCYTSSSVDEATLGLLDSHQHSMKLTGAECIGSESSWDVITSTSEKFRGSAIYEQSGGCYNGANPTRAHGSSFIEVWKKL